MGGSRCNLESAADSSSMMHIDVFVRPRLCHSPVLSVHHNEALSSSKRGGSGVKDYSTGREISCQPPHTSDPLINYFWGKERNARRAIDCGGASKGPVSLASTTCHGFSTSPLDTTKGESVAERGPY